MLGTTSQTALKNEIIFKQHAEIEQLRKANAELTALVKKWEAYGHILRERGFVTPKALESNK